MPASNAVAPVLGAHQAESGIVTERELDLSQRWVEAVTPDCGGQRCGDVWLDRWLGTELPFSFRYGGQEWDAALDQWLLGDTFETSDASQGSVFVWTDEATGLRVSWQVRAFSDFPAVEWVVTFENRGSHDTAIIEDVQALDLNLNHCQAGQPYVVHGAEGGRSKPDDMMPFSRHVPGPPFWRVLELGGDHPSGNRHLPFFNIETPEKRGVMVGIGWSGNWLARMRPDETRLCVQAGLKESCFTLHPGECIRTPRVLLLFWEGERLHAHNMWRRLLHKHYVPALHGAPQQPLVSTNVAFTYHGEGDFLHEATEEPVLAVIDPFAEIGAELFIIDAGWYEGEPWMEWLGNWRHSPNKYPRGLRPISDRLAAAGIEFGIWFASEMVNSHAPVVQEHPDWIRWRVSGRVGTLRMDIPEAREWFLSNVDDLVENARMTCYRQDGSGSYDEEPDHRKGVSESQHIAGLYESWDEMVRRHPGLIMEGCSGGGRRIDLETVSRFHWHQKSDRWFDSESDQCSLYGANLYLPGGLMNLPTAGTDDYTAWSSFAGQLLLAWHPLDDEFPMAQAQLQVERYKRIRHLLCGDFYPLTPCSLDEEWIGYQFHRSDLEEGVAFLFRRSGAHHGPFPASDVCLARLRGLDPAIRYRVRSERDDTVQTLMGEALAKGVEAIVREAPGAEMISYERVG